MILHLSLIICLLMKHAALHKSGVGTHTGEHHTSNCYRDGSPSVERTHTHAVQQKAKKLCLKHCMRQNDKRREMMDGITAGVINRLHAPRLSVSFSNSVKDMRRKQVSAAATCPHFYPSCCSAGNPHQTTGTDTC